MDDFVHLHLHSHYSKLDGLGKPDDYAKRAAELGQPALGLTDHGTLSGAFEHWKQCGEHGIKPIVGCELYVAPSGRRHRQPVFWGAPDQRREDVSGAGSYTHLTVIATGSEGLRNLYRLQADAFASGFYYKPRTDLEALSRYSEGLICLTGCPSGAVATRLRLEDADGARVVAGTLHDIFPGRLWVELMTHGARWEEDVTKKLLDEIHKPLSLPTVVTNDAHYCAPEDASVHSALLCVQTQSTLEAPTFTFDGAGYYLKSHAEMQALGLPQSGLTATLDIAERVLPYDEVFEHRLRMPRHPDEDALRGLCSIGLTDRVGAFPEVYHTRLKYECDTIIEMGYSGYFLVLADIIQEAKREGIRIGPGRGSAGGSLVAYALGITELDPIAHGLLFERFLNPSRVSLPDIDIDVDEGQRPRFLELVRRKYGDDAVAQIGTLGTIGAKAALKDANRVLGGAYQAGEALTRNLPPPKFGRPPTLADYKGPSSPTVDLARGLEGTIRNEGIHAAGVVISPEPLTTVLPLRKAKGEGGWITEFTMEEVADLGLVKFDFLGLRNLGVIDECLHMLESTGISVSLPVLPGECSDYATYSLLASGETLGVFQLDGPGMRGLLRSLQPTEFADISAVLALYRPGPMDAGAHTEYAKRKRRDRWDPSWAIHPELEEVLRPVVEETFGLIVYQEQVLQTLNVVCGWSYAEAGLLFDAMRKKNHDKMAASRPEYQKAGLANGFSKEALDALWETLVPFADYSFNRAHSVGYGLVAYWTAYLKAHFPREYMSALLSSVAEDPDRLPEYLAETRRLGIEILPPDINYSGVGFSPSPTGIHYGLGAIRGVGENAYQAVVSKRPYASLDDFFKRAPAKVLNAGVLSALIRSGTLDSLSPLREELYVAREALSARALTYRAEVRAGSVPLYPVSFGVGRSGLFSEDVRRGWELETLSTVLTRPSVTVEPDGRLDAPRAEWLKSQVAHFPGDTVLTLQLGAATVSVGNVDWERLKGALQAAGGWRWQEE